MTVLRPRPPSWSCLLATFLGLVAPAVAVPVRVFFDTNGDGRQDPGEVGAPRVLVSDGEQVWATDPDGRVDTEGRLTSGRRLLSVVVPGGHRPSTPWYVTPTGETQPVQFGLAPQAARGEAVFAVTGGPGSTDYATALLSELAPAEERPAFVAVLGGLGEPSAWAAWRPVQAAAPLPLHLVCGGVTDSGTDPVAAFEEQLGPAWYAFWSGGRCFVVLVGDSACLTAGEQACQALWVRRLINALPERAEVAVLSAVPPPPDRLRDVFARVSLRAVFYAHWPQQSVWWLDRTAMICTPPYRSDAFGAGSGGFRRVRLGPDAVIAEPEVSGVTQLLEVLTPGPLQVPDRLALPLRVAAYDSRWPVESVTARLDDGPPLPLRRAGRYTWRLDLPAVAAAQLQFAARTAGGPTWDRHVSLPAQQPSPRVEPTAGSAPPRPPLVRAWLASTESPRVAWCDPLVANGQLYLPAPDDRCPGQSAIVCLDGVTGTQRWRTVTPSPVRRELVADGARIFALTADNQVLALDATGGGVLWRTALTPDPPGRHRSGLSGLTVWRDRLLVPTGDGPLVALNQTDGSEAARLDLALSWSGAPAADPLHALLACADGLLSVNAASLEPGWHTSGLELPRHGPVVLGDSLAYVLGPELVAVDRHDGALRWRRPLPSSGLDLGAVTVSEGTVYVPGAHPWAVRASTGASLWSEEEPPAEPRPGRVTLAGGLLWGTSDDGVLACFDPAEGRCFWSCEVGLPIKSSPVVAGGAVYLVDIDGNVHCFVHRELR